MSESLFRLVASKTHEVDRAVALRMAEKHASMQHSPTERDLDPKHVEELVSRIKGGRMIPFCWATVKYGSKTYRMNGQHSSSALLAAADSTPVRVVIHFDEFEAGTPEAMAELFRQFDSRISTRSRQDVAGAYQGLVLALEKVDRRHGKLGVEGVAWYQRSIEKLPVQSGDDLYGMFLNESYHPFLRWLNGVLSVKTPELKNAPVVGAMYATYIASESGAQEFWTHVARGDLVDDDDPRSVLSRALVEIKENKDVPRPAPAEFYAKCVKAWNAFRGGEKVRSLSVNTKKGLPDVAA